VSIDIDIDPALEESLVPRRRSGLPAGAYAFIAAAMAFSGVAAYVVFTRPPPQPQVIFVNTPGVPTATGAASAVEDKGQPQIEVGSATAVTSTRPPLHVGGPMPRASASTSTPAPAIDTGSFVTNVPPPAATAPPPPSGGGQLSQGEIQGVVAQNTALMKRKCWQPALEARPPDGPSNARVMGSIVVGPSGAVESASANGAEKDFPGLSSCIASRMKNWKFPPSGGSTPVNVPFVFAGQ
jgi:hypothetical protein